MRHAAILHGCAIVVTRMTQPGQTRPNQLVITMKIHRPSLFAVTAIASVFAVAMTPTQANASAKEASIGHTRIKPIVWKCEDRLREVNAFAKTKGIKADEPGTLLLSAIRGKPLYNEPVASLAWMDMHLRMYGNTKPLTLMQGEARGHVLQLATLVHNDYIIASQMMLGLKMAQPTWPKEQGTYVARLIVGLTDTAEDVPMMAETISNVENAFEMIAGVSPSLRGYARWAIRGFAYDDDVAIDATMTGMCQAGPSAKDKAVIEKAIKASQFRP